MESGRAKGADPTRVMIDCGLALKDVNAGLQERGLALSDLHAIFVTHEHTDHVSGVARLARAGNLKVFVSHGTKAACPEEFWRGVDCIEIDSHEEIDIGRLCLRAYPVPHDAREPTQVVVEDRHHRLGVLTDTGQSTAHIESMLGGTDALFLEANHDAQMLAKSDYPPALKARIAGPFGHLSNDQSADLLSRLDQSRLQACVAGHLSRHNNTIGHVQKALAPAITGAASLSIAFQGSGMPWMELA